MNTKRFLLTLIAFALMLPLSGCGCRRNSCNDDRRYAPPAGCCDKSAPPDFLPNPRP